MRESGSRLVVAGSDRADRLGIQLPDLVSRLGWGVTYALSPLDGDTVQQALVHRASSRGLELPEETATFLLKRIPRDLPSVFELLDRLDEASMVEQRRLTIPFVKAVLDETS
jgi:DnaA family protein